MHGVFSRSLSMDRIFLKLFHHVKGGKYSPSKFYSATHFRSSLSGDCTSGMCILNCLQLVSNDDSGCRNRDWFAAT